jgi:hypothetical protein
LDDEVLFTVGVFNDGDHDVADAPACAEAVDVLLE